MPSSDGPGRYEYLTHNAPMSVELAGSLVASATRGRPRSIVDIGCGWGELLLQAVAAAVGATGVGVDCDAASVKRAQARARERGLSDRTRFAAVDALAATDTGDLVICVGADHSFGSQADALQALGARVHPGGRLLFGTGFWEAMPTPAQAAALGASPDDFLLLPALVRLVESSGFRLLDLRTATRREWEAFEFGFLADAEEWLLHHADHPDATAVRDRADRHRRGYLDGYRDVLGFAYLVLGRPAAPAEATAETL